jgi:HPt (histidine-containing phosphotransfer) domain-containing protein
MTANAPPAREPRIAVPGHAGLDHPVLDHTVLEQLRVDLEDEDGSAVADLVGLYLASAQSLLPDITTALRSGDHAAAARLAHALASPSELVGAGPLGSLLRRVQTDAYNPGVQPADLAALAEIVGSEGDRVVRAFAELRPAGTAAADPAA